jgi:hypothetical protein
VERKKVPAWDSHRSGKVQLPPGYHLELDADLMELRREALRWIAHLGEALTFDTRAIQNYYREALWLFSRLSHQEVR